MSVICKLFIQNSTNFPGGSTSYQLGAVCRGEENKHWAEATPSGSLKHPANDALDAAFESASREVEVTITPDPEGAWKLVSCAFTYGGCAVVFRLAGKAPDYQHGEMTLNINAKPATKVLREAFAESLTEGKAASFRLEVAPTV